MDMTQISNWFRNERKRIWLPLKRKARQRWQSLSLSDRNRLQDINAEKSDYLASARRDDNQTTDHVWGRSDTGRSKKNDAEPSHPPAPNSGAGHEHGNGNAPKHVSSRRKGRAATPQGKNDQSDYDATPDSAKGNQDRHTEYSTEPVSATAEGFAPHAGSDIDAMDKFGAAQGGTILEPRVLEDRDGLFEPSTTN